MFSFSKQCPLEDSSLKQQEIDAKDLSNMDLQSLYKQDPFMYYSITSIHMATLRGTDIDTSNLNGVNSSSIRRDSKSPFTSASLPSGIIGSSQVLRRQTRISFEADSLHLMLTMMQDDEDASSDDEDDKLFQLLGW